jgi:hypothetical protein
LDRQRRHYRRIGHNSGIIGPRELLVLEIVVITKWLVSTGFPILISVLVKFLDNIIRDWTDGESTACDELHRRQLEHLDTACEVVGRPTDNASFCATRHAVIRDGLSSFDIGAKGGSEVEIPVDTSMFQSLESAQAIRRSLVDKDIEATSDKHYTHDQENLTHTVR